MTKTSRKAPRGRGLRAATSLLARSLLATSLLTAAAGIATPALAADRDPDLLALGIGIYDQSWIDPPAFFQVDADTPHDRSQFVTAEYRFGWSLVKVDDWFAIKPLVGVMETFKGAFYGYGGLQADFTWGPFFITPSAAAGYYAHGDGKDMGYPLEFRTQIETGYRFSNGDRFSIALSHISNAELGKTVTIPGTPRTRTVNPGANNLVAYYSFAL
ncbi:acyloxyacyl hydrolase [Nitrospirillum sp. BR 11164]|uniref:acyloxyacyl hydrolase n=1 Tax=Nitrospirillum sp. BR 11164 TaxID=3104324 RepID=UPI002AFF0DF1|nr:acyloxyacyl hydrolase [Nitrospirillum sp. BR 11164]MEA1649444.1 acyloxyacyl hydrolase [Nitrospirillum sp. BR 11164]